MTPRNGNVEWCHWARVSRAQFSRGGGCSPLCAWERSFLVRGWDMQGVWGEGVRRSAARTAGTAMPQQHLRLERRVPDGSPGRSLLHRPTATHADVCRVRRKRTTLHSPVAAVHVAVVRAQVQPAADATRSPPIPVPCGRLCERFFLRRGRTTSRRTGSPPSPVSRPSWVANPQPHAVLSWRMHSPTPCAALACVAEDVCIPPGSCVGV